LGFSYIKAYYHLINQQDFDYHKALLIYIDHKLWSGPKPMSFTKYLQKLIRNPIKLRLKPLFSS